jgi:preprotein translocase subunit SecA
VSIGLEAFAQRDPLVQYKSKATELFKNLLVEIRSGVVTRMFMAQPTRRALATAERTPAPAAESPEPVPAGPASSGGGEQSPGERSGKKRKRKRH